MSNNCTELYGTVVDTHNGLVKVSISNDHCSSCMCSCKNGNREIRIKSHRHFNNGDSVVITYNGSSVYVLSAIMYGIPILFMCIFAVIGVYGLKLSQLASAVFSVLSLVPAWYVVKKLSAKQKYPEISRR
ncbi:MAG: SoxR reducing system RseC family protein [Deferribacterales bacterium]|nr:SoxR reducing system RseC family protein [Deferribacterales bacterium]